MSCTYVFNVCMFFGWGLQAMLFSNLSPVMVIRAILFSDPVIWWHEHLAGAALVEVLLIHGSGSKTHTHESVSDGSCLIDFDSVCSLSGVGVWTHDLPYRYMIIRCGTQLYF